MGKGKRSKRREGKEKKEGRERSEIRWRKREGLREKGGEEIRKIGDGGKKGKKTDRSGY